jgi:hypothetical protein
MNWGFLIIGIPLLLVLGMVGYRVIYRFIQDYKADLAEADKLLDDDPNARNRVHVRHLRGLVIILVATAILSTLGRGLLLNILDWTG